jgi:hypothetical protein
MMLPAFTGIDAVRHTKAEGLINPRGFIIVDEHQRNPTFKNIRMAQAKYLLCNYMIFTWDSYFEFSTLSKATLYYTFLSR